MVFFFLILIYIFFKNFLGLAFFLLIQMLTWHLKNVKYIYYYYFISHVNKQCIPFTTSAFSVTGLMIGTILKTIFENQGLT